MIKNKFYKFNDVYIAMPFKNQLNITKQNLDHKIVPLQITLKLAYCA